MSRRRRAFAALGAVVVLVAAVLGAWLTSGRYEVRRDGPLVVADADWFDVSRGGMDALLGGDLRIEGGCACLGDEVVIWPDGTEWLADERALRLPSGGIAHEGDGISGGGGAFHIEDAETARLFAGCAQQGEEFNLFNLHEQLELVAAD